MNGLSRFYLLKIYLTISLEPFVALWLSELLVHLSFVARFGRQHLYPIFSNL